MTLAMDWVRRLGQILYYAVLPMLPELQKEAPGEQLLAREYSSADYLMDIGQLKELLEQHLLTGQAAQPTEELLA